MRHVFVDSSAFYALLDETDPHCKEAGRQFARAEAEKWNLVITNYVLQESAALIQHRLGWAALDAWLEVTLPMCEIVWVDEALHRTGAARWNRERSRRLSLTDCVSFEVMRRRGLREALAFDEHFAVEGMAAPA